ncbi:Polysaccharide deacetylase [Caulifigura coniformis]|uniref:Polysaccharide deacetylase n=1 Tax=Caulifigura coniformis TaxID=2527983 RepID=A0A517SGY8_9PLAN|nr:polysaccharide deacetylase family protein [Caulifigura coniformis]QDT55394.1 Polysaccharide deacetylase [Caulifigura coniformis]
MSQFVCLMYHDVCRREDLAPGGLCARLSPSIRSYSVTTEQFAAQVVAIGRDRWMDPRQLGTPDLPAPADSRPRVLLTFDDGWKGSIQEAGPILARAGARAILFVTTGLIGHPLFADEAMLRDLSTDVFEVGAHTVTHPFLAECTTERIRRELRDSRQTLEDILGRCVDCVSIPNGSVDQRVLDLASECGYEFVFTSETRMNASDGSPGPIGRVAVRSETSTENVVQWANGTLGAASWRRRALELPRRLLGPKRYRRLRSCALGEQRGQDDMAELVSENHRAEASLVSTH